MNESRVRWGRLIAHAVTALISGAVLGAVGAISFASLPPYEAGRIGGSVGMIACFAVGVASYLAQSGQKRIVTIGGAAVAVAVGVFFVLLPPQQSLTTIKHALGEGSATAGSPLPYAFTAADRAPLVEVVAPPRPTRLQHPTFGFSILRPPSSFVEEPSNVTGEQIRYDYLDKAQHVSCFVAITLGGSGTRAGLEEYLDGVRKGFEQRARDGSGASLNVLERHVVGDDAHLEGRLHAELSGLHMRARLHPIQHDGSWLVVMLVVASGDPDTLADVLDSFQP